MLAHDAFLRFGNGITGNQFTMKTMTILYDDDIKPQSINMLHLLIKA